MSKADRQLMIKQIIMNEDIRTQDELLRRLNDNGFSTTQATISRDISELNLVKASDGNQLPKYVIYHEQAPQQNNRFKSTFQRVVLSIKQVEFMNIVKTQPANAHVIGAIVDDLALEEITGTIAGNDTVLIISSSSQDARAVSELLKGYLEVNN